VPKERRGKAGRHPPIYTGGKKDRLLLVQLCYEGGAKIEKGSFMDRGYRYELKRREGRNPLLRKKKFSCSSKKIKISPPRHTRKERESCLHQGEKGKRGGEKRRIHTTFRKEGGKSRGKREKGGGRAVYSHWKKEKKRGGRSLFSLCAKTWRGGVRRGFRGWGEAVL